MKNATLAFSSNKSRTTKLLGGVCLASKEHLRGSFYTLALWVFVPFETSQLAFRLVSKAGLEPAVFLRTFDPCNRHYALLAHFEQPIYRRLTALATKKQSHTIKTLSKCCGLDEIRTRV